MQPSQEPPTQPEGFTPIRKAKEHHWYRPRNVAIGALVLIGTGVIAGIATSSAQNNAQPVPAVTVTRTAHPVATATNTVNVRVTQTVNVAPKPEKIAHYSGTGNWNSPQFSLTGAPLTVKFSYWNNTSGYGGDNFIADVTNVDLDDLQIANEIGTSGGKTTTLYPTGSGLYHLEVQATGPWSITITQQPST